MWGIVPAAGLGTRLQPLACSKELLPVGARPAEDGSERPRAVSEYLLERMALAGVRKVCWVVGPGKTDIMEYYGGRFGALELVYAVQPRPAGLCDALFQALPVIPPDEQVVIGLPDTIWFPADGLNRLGDADLSFLLFPVAQPERFDAVLTDAAGRVREVQVKEAGPASRWVWGALKARGQVLHDLHALWRGRSPRDEYLGTLVNAWLAGGGQAAGVRAGRTYVDVGTLDGYREAQRLLAA